ncbi:MAG: hypothetical protein R3F62_02425 [Planctomycetota bacterium]
MTDPVLPPQGAGLGVLLGDGLGGFGPRSDVPGPALTPARRGPRPGRRPRRPGPRPWRARAACVPGRRRRCFTRAEFEPGADLSAWCSVDVDQDGDLDALGQRSRRRPGEPPAQHRRQSAPSRSPPALRPWAWRRWTSTSTGAWT